MSTLDQKFNNVISTIITNGITVKNRTGIDTITYPGVIIRHDMEEGFPLLTIRRIPYKSAFTEMEGFINGITDKQWYKDRKCHFWDYWCNPLKLENSNIIYGSDEAKNIMFNETDLGHIYGYQWRNFNGVDQLSEIINTLKTNPNSRRMVCSAWNPSELNCMALPPCHFAWQVTVTNNKLNLFYMQRSCDWILGNNLVGYGLLLKLLALESGFKEGMLIGTFNDCHIYVNHVDGAKQLLNQLTNKTLPTLKINNFTSIFNWKATNCIINNYNPSNLDIKFSVAI